MKPSRIITFFTLILFGMNIHGQIGWEWAYAEYCSSESRGFDVVVDSLGNTYVVGNFGGQTEFGDIVATASGKEDLFLAKLDPERNLLWFRQGGVHGINHANGVVVDDSLNVYVTGSLNNDGFNFIRKYDSEGTLVWDQTLDHGYFWFEAGEMITRSKNKIIFASPTYIWTINYDGTGLDGYLMNNSTLSNFENGMFAAASKQEVVLLDEELNQLSSFSLPAGIKLLHSIILNSSDIYITGWYAGTVVMGDSIFTGSYNMFLAKMDATGQFIWASQGGGDSQDVGSDLVINDSNQLFVAGTYSNVATFDTVTIGNMGFHGEIFVAEYNMNNGRLVDIINAHGEGYSDTVFSMVVTPENDVLVTGSLTAFNYTSFGDVLVYSNSSNIDFFLAKAQQQVVSRLSGTVTADGAPLSTEVILYRKSPDNEFYA